jgi:hypothetical protein
MNLGGCVSSFVLRTKGDSDSRSSRGISEKEETEILLFHLYTVNYELFQHI